MKNIFIIFILLQNPIIDYSKKIDLSIQAILRDSLMIIFLNELEIVDPTFNIDSISSFNGPNLIIEKKNWGYIIDTLENNDYKQRYLAYLNKEIYRMDNYKAISIDRKILSYYNCNSKLNIDYDYFNDSLFYIHVELSKEYIPHKYNQKYGFIVKNGLSFLILSGKDTTKIINTITIK